MNLLNKCKDRFSSFVKFDPVKEILKIRCQIYILMKKVIIFKRIRVTMKTVAPPTSAILQPFQFEPEQKKKCGNKSLVN